jgi:hypothetical protein
MSDPGSVRPLSGWQRAYIVSAAEYLRELARGRPGEQRAQAVYEGLLEVLEPSRRMTRQYHERYPTTRVGSMWDQRSGRERRIADRRAADAGPAVTMERRRAPRRSGCDRRRNQR